jgi:Abnormal spindle-like microcephaly-assoc'd, ASPM-SPD-2-Hydin
VVQNIDGMRFFPRIVCALVLSLFAPGSIWAQQLTCSPCTYHFHRVLVGQYSTSSITLTNSGTKSLRITSKSVQGTAFSVGNLPLPMTLRAGASAQMSVTFTPTAAGHQVGGVKLVSTPGQSTLQVVLAGTGANQKNTQLNLSPSALNFGNVTLGSSATLSVTLTAANGTVTISSDKTNSSEFSVQGPSLPVTLQAGQSVQATIQFTPNASGQATAKAGFFSDAQNSPAVESLTGTGVAQNSHSVALTWDPSQSQVVGYNVYRSGQQGGPYTVLNGALDASTNYTDNNVVSGATYFYAVTAVDSSGDESAYSNITEAVIPTP